MPSKYAETTKRWKAANKTRELENCRRWSKENIEFRRAYRRKLYLKQKLDPEFRLKKILRNRFSKLIKGKEKYQSILKYLGCTVDQLKIHIETQFNDQMTWENHGKVWHVDHVIPLARFDHSNEEEIYKAWNYTNLRPLLCIDNLRKGDR